MGCCETREETKEKIIIPSLHVKKSSLRSLEMQNMNDQDRLVFTRSQVQKFKIMVGRDSGSLALYIEWCKQNGKWEELVSMITYKIETSGPKGLACWAENPTTIGSMCVVYLGFECKINPQLICPLLDQSLLYLINTIRTSKPDFKENAIILVHYFLEKASTSSIIKLTKFGIFNVIVGFFTYSKIELQHLAAAVCRKIYKNRDFAQLEFLNNNGANELAGLLQRSRNENEDVINELIDSILDLALDEYQVPLDLNVARINNTNLSQIISGLDKDEMPKELLMKVGGLLTILGANVIE